MNRYNGPYPPPGRWGKGWGIAWGIMYLIVGIWGLLFIGTLALSLLLKMFS